MFWVVDGDMRKQRERESRGVKSFPFVCPPDGHSAIMLLLRGRDLICTSKGYLHRDEESLHIFHIMYKTKTNMKSKKKIKRKTCHEIIIGKMEIMECITRQIFDRRKFC
jgi:hypothetical protein